MSDIYKLQYSYYPEGTGTDIVPLAACMSANNFLYKKNFGTITTAGNNTWTINFDNTITGTDKTKLSFMLGGDLVGGLVGGVYGYEGTANKVTIDYNSAATRRGVVMFGPRSYYTGPDSGLPKILAIVANSNSNATSAAQIQEGLSLTGQNSYNIYAKFDDSLTSNLYGIYGLVSTNGTLLRSYSYNNTGFTFNVMNQKGDAVNNNANYSFVVVQ